MNFFRYFIKSVLMESSPERRAFTRAKTGGRINPKLEMWKLADSLITDPPTAFFTMTRVQKVGINPQSTFDTPLALYSYPVTEELVDKLMGVYYPDEESPEEELASAKSLKKAEEISAKIKALNEAGTYAELPFVSGVEYITFFSLDPAGVFYTSIGMSSQELDAAVDRLRQFIRKYAGESTDEILGDAESYARSYHRSALAGGNNVGNLSALWTMTRQLSQYLTSGEHEKLVASEISSRPMVLWRRLLLTAGVNAVVDDAGLGLIHVNEKVQASIFSMSIVNIIQQFDNRTSAATELPGRKRAEDITDDEEPEVSSNSVLGDYFKNLSDEDFEQMQAIKKRADAGENTVTGLNEYQFSDIRLKLRAFEDATGERSSLLDIMLKDAASVVQNFTPDDIKTLKKFNLLATERFGSDPETDELIVQSVISMLDRAKSTISKIPLENREPIFYFTHKNPDRKSIVSRDAVVSAFMNLYEETWRGLDMSKVLSQVIDRPYGAGDYAPAIASALIKKFFPEGGIEYLDVKGNKVKLVSAEQAIKRYNNIGKKK